MSKYKFDYKTLRDVQDKASQLGVALPLREKTDILTTPYQAGNVALPNRMGIAPMEGFDANPDGTPSEYTSERYLKYAGGGAGLIWYEAVSIVQEGCSCQHQLYLTEKNLDAFKRLNDKIKEESLRKNGYAPYLIMQANHSGRYSRPGEKAAPIIAYRHPEIEKLRPADDSCIATDDYLKSLEEKFGEASRLGRKAGFDAIDVKACHGYLLGELASAYTRKGEYGGSFENRFRLLFNSILSAQQSETKDYSVVARIGIYDQYAYPYGFGVKKDGGLEPDYEEPVRLIGDLHKKLHVPFINITMGDPHVQPHVTRPFNRDDMFDCPEDPLLSVARMYEGTAEVKKRYPELGVSASAPSYLRQFAPNLAAGAIEAGVCDQVIFGRLAFANPDFPNDIKNERKDAKKACYACSKCTTLGRTGWLAGCVLHQQDPYLKRYREIMANKK